jgi:hypothetical protein
MSEQKEKGKDYYKIKDHQLYVTRFGVLLRLFRDNKYNRSNRGKVFKIFVFSFLLQPFIWLQKLIFGYGLSRVDFKKDKAPIIILGHWRSGTTHLHSLIYQDPKLGTLNYYMNFLINVCLLGWGWLPSLLKRFMPKKRPMDNMKIDLYSPQEEEPALTNMTSHAAIHGMYFPENRSYFEKYQLFQGISAKEKKKWAKSYDEIMRMIAYTNKGKRVLTKNPFNTSRVKELLEIYPDAKFIYIHRDPYDVYRSTQKLYTTSIETQVLSELTPEMREEMIMDNYRLILQKYLDERALIPEGNLVEISFDELTDDWNQTISRVYSTLGLPGFQEALPHFEKYMESVKGYKKNVFKPLPKDTMLRIEKEWGFSFKEWGYEIRVGADETA